MLNKKSKILTCAVLVEELKTFLPEEVDCETLDFGLHRSPEKLRASLQEKIDESNEYDTIILSFGLCGMAVLGLHSDTSRIIVPRADDCIAILIGSREAYLKEQRDHPGSLFLTRGWIEGKLDDMSPYSEVLDSLIKKYGEDRGRRMYSLYEKKNPLRHYKRLAFITTGDGTELEEYRTVTIQRANKLSLTYEEIQGSTSFLEKIANGSWGDEFIVAPPGHVISVDDFWPNADKEEPPSSAWS